MADESKIEDYRHLFEMVQRHAVKSVHFIDWQILEKHKLFIKNIERANSTDIGNVQKEFNSFLTEQGDISFAGIYFFSYYIHTKVNLKPAPAPRKPNFDDILQIIADISREIKYKNSEHIREVRNSYITLQIIRECIKDYGLLLDEIKKRSENQLYNFVVYIRTGKRKKPKPHFFITKEKLDEYVDLFNKGKDMLIDGISVEFSSKNDVFISATKLKNKQEVELYKNKYRIYGDLDFAKNKKDESICSIITSQLIKSQIIRDEEPTKKSNPIKELVGKDKINEAIDVALKLEGLSNEDRDTFTLLKSRYVGIKKLNNKGTVGHDIFTKELNNIRTAILDTVTELED